MAQRVEVVLGDKEREVLERWARSLVGLGYDETRDHLVLRDPCRRVGTAVERGADIHFDGVVPEEQAVVDHVDVPLVEAAVTRTLALVSLVPQEHDPAGAHDSDHVGDDFERVGAVIE
jgi:hypothetical protein